MRIACLQFAPQVGRVSDNIARADAILSEADPDDLDGLDLLVLPELAFSGMLRPVPVTELETDFARVQLQVVRTRLAVPRAHGFRSQLAVGACLSKQVWLHRRRRVPREGRGNGGRFRVLCRSHRG